MPVNRAQTQPRQSAQRAMRQSLARSKKERLAKKPQNKGKPRISWGFLARLFSHELPKYRRQAVRDLRLLSAVSGSAARPAIARVSSAPNKNIWAQ